VTRSIRSLLLLCLAASAAVNAEGVRLVSGSVGATSDFVYRGLSLTRGKPALQASLDVEFPREFYVGGFIATADPNPGPSPGVEFDVWAGRYWRVGEDFSADLRLSQYTYPDDPRRINYNRGEVTGTLGWRNRLFVAAIYSPNTRALGSSPGYEQGDVWSLEVSARHTFNARYSLSAGVGHYGLESVYRDSYNYWNLTLTAALKPFELQLAWLGVDPDINEHFSGDSVGNRVALTALWRFSTSP
jgi:uncharacterized protein (TIGR02001 family)